MTKLIKHSRFMVAAFCALALMVVIPGCGRYAFEQYDPDARYQQCVNRCLAEQGKDITYSCETICRDKRTGTPSYPEPVNY